MSKAGFKVLVLLITISLVYEQLSLLKKAWILIPGEEALKQAVIMRPRSPHAPSEHHHYHEWGEKSDNSTVAIQLLPILQLINRTYYRPLDWHQSYVAYGPFPMFVAVQNNTPTMWIASNTMRSKRKKALLKDRFGVILPHLQRALKVQLYQHRERFPALMKALTTVGSIPLFFDVSDYIGCCNAGNYNEHPVVYNSTSPPPEVGYFTISKPTSCNYGFPIPSYSTYRYATTLIGNYSRWEDRMEEWNSTYPWESKIPQVFWRGVRSGRFLKHRVKFLERVVRADPTLLLKEEENQSQQSVFNVHTTRTIYSEYKGKYPSVFNITPPEESMKYKAAFDLDGNAWSERFPRLLCYNSAVIKIDVPHENEEYFMGHTVLPGIHYIPASLANFTRVARFVLHPSQDDMLRQVVRNANAWCAERMKEEMLNLDFLSVLNGYVETLQEGWMEEWAQVFAAHVGPKVQNGTGGFTNSVLDNGVVDFEPKIRWLEGPTSWRVEDYVAPMA